MAEILPPTGFRIVDRTQVPVVLSLGSIVVISNSGEQVLGNQGEDVVLSLGTVAVVDSSGAPVVHFIG